MIDHRTHISMQGRHRKDGNEGEHMTLYLQMSPSAGDAYIVGEREQVHRVWARDGLESIMVAEKRAEVGSQSVRETMKAIAQEVFGGIGNEEGVPNGIII